MIRLFGPAAPTERGLGTRREMLRIGGVLSGGLLTGGLSLSGLLGARAATAGASETAGGQPGEGKTAAPNAAPRSFGAAKRCIMLYLSGGPPQHDTFDPKPDAPAEIRGEFGTIETTLPGVRVGEHLPRSARWMHKVAQVRSMCHTHNDHARGSYWMFTGYPFLGSVPDANNMTRADMPHLGACVAKIAPGDGLFPFAIAPYRMDVAEAGASASSRACWAPSSTRCCPAAIPMTTTTAWNSCLWLRISRWTP